MGNVPQEYGTYVGAPGDEARGAALSDERKGIDREVWVLPYQPVHGSLERARCAARRHRALACHRDQVSGDLVRPRAPESRTGSAWLGVLYHLYWKVVCFNIFNQFRVVHNRRHDNPP